MTLVGIGQGSEDFFAEGMTLVGIGQGSEDFFAAGEDRFLLKKYGGDV